MSTLTSLCDSYVNDCPAVVTVLYSAVEHRELDLTGMKMTLGKFLTTSNLIHDRNLRRELYIFGKLLYRLNKPFGHHRHIQLGKRIRRLFNRVRGTRLDIDTAIRQFRNSIHINRDDSLFCMSGKCVRLLLAKLVTTTLILARLLHDCVDCAVRATGMLDMGHNVQPHCILVGTLSRLRLKAAEIFRALLGMFDELCEHGVLERMLRMKITQQSDQSASDDDSEQWRQIYKLREHPLVKSALENEKRIREIDSTKEQEIAKFASHILSAIIPTRMPKGDSETTNTVLKDFRLPNAAGLLSSQETTEDFDDLSMDVDELGEKVVRKEKAPAKVIVKTVNNKNAAETVVKAINGKEAAKTAAKLGSEKQVSKITAKAVSGKKVAKIAKKKTVVGAEKALGKIVWSSKLASANSWADIKSIYRQLSLQNGTTQQTVSRYLERQLRLTPPTKETTKRLECLKQKLARVFDKLN